MILFKQYVLTAGAVALSDSTIFNVGAENASPVTPVTKASQLIIRNATGAANPIYLGGSNVTNAPANAGIQIAAAEVRDIGPFEADLMDLRSIFIVGTVNAANIAFLTVVI